MRHFTIVLLCFSSLCLAQEKYHNEEFGFTIEAPSGWQLRLEDEWSDKVKAVLKKHYFSSSNLLILNPSGTKTLNVPSIIVHGIKLKRTTTSEAIADLKKNGRNGMISSAENIARYDVLGKKINQYRKIDTFYDYNSSKNLAIAIILYQHEDEENTHFMAATAKFIGLQRVIDFRGYWKGDDPEEFQKVFDEVINSFEFDQDAKPKGILGAVPQEIKEVGRLSKEQKFNRIWKWGGAILTISIILGFIKMLLGR